MKFIPDNEIPLNKFYDFFVEILSHKIFIKSPRKDFIYPYYNTNNSMRQNTSLYSFPEIKSKNPEIKSKNIAANKILFIPIVLKREKSRVE